MKTKRFLAILLCALMLGNLFPVSAFATGETEEEIFSSVEMIDEEILSDSHQGAEDEFVEEQAIPPDESTDANESLLDLSEAEGSVEPDILSDDADVIILEDDSEELIDSPATPSNMPEDRETETSDQAGLPDVSAEETSGTEPDIEPETEETFESEYPAFNQSKTAGGVTITVKADAGVFPADAVLHVEEVPVYLEEQAEAAIGNLRDNEATVAVSYTFDIKIINPATGEEYQPAEGQTVSVAFALAEVADENLTTSVYHVPDEGGAEKLDVSQEDSVTAVVETDGFSLYTVEFTYNSLQYVLPGDSSIAMSEILAEVGLNGEVTAVEISDTSLFSASNETGEWVVTAHQAFSTTEWMKVTINGVVYEIQVTDDEEPIVVPTHGYTLYLNQNYDGAVSAAYDDVTTITLPSSTRSGYLFQGWAETATGIVVYKAGDTITLTSNKTLYAVWLIQSLIGGIPASSGGYVYMSGIRWRIIGESENKLLLISADVLDGYKTWSDAKNYCGTVYNGMTSLEQAAVLDTTKTDVAYGSYEASDLNNAKLFLLSASEALTYFSSNADRQPGWWWLRSPHRSRDNFVGCVYGGGILDLDYVYIDNNFGARPAFQLNLESVLFESAAEGGKSSAAAGGGEFGDFSDSTGSDLKLTLIDSSRSGFSASAASATVAPGATLAVNYSGANTRTNEYVSAMLCDTSGNVLYYASLTPDSSGSGTWNMTIPGSLAGGSYTLKVFSEQQNRDKLTDYASSPVAIALTVSGEAVTNFTVTIADGITNGSVTADKTTAAEGETVTLTVTPAEGYEIDTLTVTDAASSAVTVENNQFTMPAGNVTVTATFKEIPKYTVSFDAGDEGATGTMDSVTIASGTTYSLPESTFTEPDGKNFKEWSVKIGDADAVSKQPGDTIEVTADTTVTAVWEKAKYTVTISKDAGCNISVVADYTEEDGGTPISSGDSIEYGTVLTVTATAKPGYTLTTEPESSYTVKDDLTITAESQKQTYALTLNHENGAEPTFTGASDLSAIEYGTSVTVTAGDASEGYEFIGWYQTNGKQLTSETSYTVSVYSAMTLEARYQAKSGVVTFMANGIVQKTMTASSITADDYPADVTTMYGYELAGWDKTVDEVNSALTNGKNVTVTARFKALSASYTVTVYNGDSIEPETTTYTESKTISVTATAVSGKTFAYWLLDDSLLTYSSKAQFKASSDCVLKAAYTADALTATGTADIRTADYNSSTKKLTFVAYLTVPDGAVITKAGLVAAPGTSNSYTAGAELTSDNADYVKASAKAVGTSEPVTYTWIKTGVSIGDTWYARPYISYTYNGTTETIYGDLVTVNAGCDYDSSEKATAAIRSASYSASTKKATFVAYLTVPDDGTIVKAGLVAAPGASFDASASILTWDTATYKKVSAKATGTSEPATFTWIKTGVSAGDTWYVRAYVIYTDASGTQRTVYGELVSFTAS